MISPLHRVSLLPIVVLLLVGLGLAACSPPRGQRGGRVGVGVTTGPAVRSERILPVALIEFSDQLPQRLIRDLTRQLLPKTQTDQPTTVVLGDINNQTRTVSTDEFELLMQRIRSNLINSDAAREKLRFVSDRRRIARLNRRELIEGEEGRVARADPYEAANTYLMLGDFNRIGRGNTNYYYLEVQLVDPASNVIAFSDTYQIKQVKPE